MIEKNAYLDVLDKILPTKKEEKIRKSGYSNKIKNIDDLLQNVELRKKCFSIIAWDNSNVPQRGRFYTMGVDEQYDEIVLLMEDLGLIKADWEYLGKQPHRQVGYRLINIAYGVDKFFDLLDRINGKTAIIKKQTLEFIARHSGEQSSGSHLVDLLETWGVPKSLIEYPNTKWRMIDTVLTYYASSSSPEDHQMLFKIIEEIAHPLMYAGDKEKSLEVQDK